VSVRVWIPAAASGKGASAHAATSRRHAFTAHRSKGFTLIEMIAAFVIFAIAIGSLMQILTMSMNNARRSTDETRAALWAQSLLDNVGVGERVEAGSSNGAFDKIYRWEMHVEQIDPELIQASAPGATMGAATMSAQVGNGGTSPVVEIPQIELYHVELTVFWGGRMRERSAHFTTLRTAMPDQSQGRSLSGVDTAGGISKRSSTGSKQSQGRGQ
jgi:general secretion pathway protein I